MKSRPAGGFPALRFASARILRRFLRNRRGTVAIEFSMIGVPFLGLMTAILQTGIVFLMGMQLQAVVQSAARTLQTQQSGIVGTMTYQTFAQTYVCPKLTMFTCNNLQIQMTSFSSASASNWQSLATTASSPGFYSSTYASAAAGSGVGAQTVITLPNPAAGSIVVLQVIYPLNPVIAIMSGSTLAGAGGITDISGASGSVGGKPVYLLYGVYAFTVEP